MKGSEAGKWRQAVQEEFNFLIENKTWFLEDFFSGRKLIEGKWIFRRKFVSDGSIDRYKVRFVVRGFR